MIDPGPAQTLPFEDVRPFFHNGMTHSVFSRGKGQADLLVCNQESEERLKLIIHAASPKLIMSTRVASQGGEASVVRET